MATATVISPAEVAKLIPAVVSQAQQISIASTEDYEDACTFLQFIAGRKKQVDEVFDPIVKKAHETHKEAVAQKKKVMDPLVMAELTVKGKVRSYSDEQERIRKAEEIRLQAEAKAAADAAALVEAAQLEAQGDKELADLVIENAASAPAPVVVLPPATPRVSGVSTRSNWKFRYRNGELASLKELVQAAAKDDSLLAYLTHKDTAIGPVVKAQKSLTNIPGIEVYDEGSVSVRA